MRVVGILEFKKNVEKYVILVYKEKEKIVVMDDRVPMFRMSPVGNEMARYALDIIEGKRENG